MLERDISKIFKAYFTREAFFHIVANVPILVYTLYMGNPQTMTEIENARESLLYRTLMALKTFRLFHVLVVIKTIDRLMQKLADVFYLHRYMFMNLLSWFKATLKFLLFVHYYACGWLLLQHFKDRANIPTVLNLHQKSPMELYVDSVYLITTTISTVGFGDFKARNSEETDWAYEMVYLYLVTAGGITLFSSVTHEIFSYRKLLTSKELIKKRVSDIDYFMYQVSKLRKDKSLTEEMFKKCSDFIEQTTRKSPKYYFQDNEFYQ